jgi:hypothetical protein
MPSSAENTKGPTQSTFGDLKNTLSNWNRRLHYFTGLYFLFFIWLFCFSGLLLNHSNWKFAEFWESRQQTRFELEIVTPPPGSDLVQARDILRQLGLSGEIDWTVTRSDTNQFDFRASRPGQIFDLKTDLNRKVTTIQRIDLNGWGVTRILHTFTGVRTDDSRNTRDWMATSMWALAMDALAVGLVFMVMSSLVLWYERPQRRWSGGFALLLGMLSCGLFCFGLRWFY